MSTASTLQRTTYLLGVCLFSIAFLVFLNSSVSFVITDRIGIHRGVGDLVGTLGFVDELVALIACPIWGSLSDRVGVRTVCVLGYAIVGLSLFLFVQAGNVYPQLLLVRILFSLGGAARQVFGDFVYLLRTTYNIEGGFKNRFIFLLYVSFSMEFHCFVKCAWEFGLFFYVRRFQKGSIEKLS